MKDTISSITTGPRQSNFELLRITAMFLVLVVHADFLTFGSPSLSDFQSAPLNAFTRTIIEFLSIVCVNVFILISGWFGIRPSVKGLGNFLFQCLYFIIGIYFVMLAMGEAPVNAREIMGLVGLTTDDWFIKSYIGLYILSPVLNAFIEKATKRQLEITLIAFYCFQTYFGTLRSALFICDGYSTFSFIGLYLLARYLKLYGKSIANYGIYIYLGSALTNTIIFYLLKVTGISISLYNYITPFVVTGSAGLLLYYSKIRVNTNKIINWIAKSCFAVYLLHTNFHINQQLYYDIIKRIYTDFSGVQCLGTMLCFIALVFIVAILLDQPRRWMWNSFKKIICR
ncbi:MAG: acyltransferase [Muribaculum sp.]|nr:acyltransferase [Muribaculum sp.]